MDKQRREFIKNSCSLCASLLGLAIILPTLQSCSTLQSFPSNVKSGNIDVPKTTFTPENKIVLIKNVPSEFEIALVELGPGNYKAFVLECTHQSTSLVATKNGFFCNAHGSSFSLDGKVKNPPATRNMKELPISLSEQFISISI